MKVETELELKRSSDLKIRGEKTLIIFAISLILIFFIGFSDKLNISFIKGGLITGAVTGTANFIEDNVTQLFNNYNNYFIIIITLLFLLTIILFTFYHLRKPKLNEPKLWHAEITPEEEKEPISSWTSRKKFPLEEELDRLNEELSDLRKEEPPHLSKKNVSKKVKEYNIKEKQLERELREINARMQGYSKPTVIEASGQKHILDKKLAKIDKKISDVDSMKIKEARILSEIPQQKIIDKSDLEERKLSNEFKSISLTLSKGIKNPIYFIKDLFPKHKSKKEKLEEKEAVRLVKKIERKVEGKNPKRNELFEIEEELVKLKKEIKKS
ncbi:MAG: hypothetical protein ABH824_02790 [Nanoarchaeota archaeon]|nr:hypothetical protein [Nanoarchaeota archaeon]MBU1632095.1 hypothetical protein [Nanoarchaeota archaeon]MBU1875729.1 hypothetical protein [Nanoarchaeota archaeon]